ncbi:MAG TPA: GatB/YqeY domain-containing protein, partial [Tepidisphaeraceae bacterium]
TAVVEKLKFEIAVVDEYLPKKESAADTEKLVYDFLAKNTFTEKQFGQAMGAFMKAYGTSVEPGVANSLLRKALAGK